MAVRVEQEFLLVLQWWRGAHAASKLSLLRRPVPCHHGSVDVTSANYYFTPAASRGCTYLGTAELRTLCRTVLRYVIRTQVRKLKLRAAVRKLKLPKIMRERAMEEISLRLELQQTSLSLQTKPDLNTQKGQDEVLLRYLSFARRLCCRICSCFYLPKPRNCKSIFPFGASE